MISGDKHEESDDFHGRRQSRGLDLIRDEFVSQLITNFDQLRS
jgi:hypothetical protein